MVDKWENGCRGGGLTKSVYMVELGGGCGVVSGEVRGGDGGSKGFPGMTYRFGGNCRDFFAIYR